MSAKSTALMSLRTLLDTPVINPLGESLGVLDDIILTPHGDIAYAVIAQAGYSPYCEKRYTVSFEALRMKGNQAVLNTTPAMVEQRADMEATRWQPETIH